MMELLMADGKKKVIPLRELLFLFLNLKLLEGI